MELAILVTVLAGIAMGRFKSLSNLLGYTSVVWFVYIFYLRFNHFGKVCSGDYLEGDNTSEYTRLAKAASFADLYFGAIATLVSSLFFMVLFYSCCVDTGSKSTEDDE